MAVLDLGALRIQITVNNDQAQKGFGETQKKSEETTKKIKVDWGKVAATLQSTGQKMTRYLTVPLAGAAIASVKYASDMDETANKVGEVFGDSARLIDEWSQNSIQKMGLAQQTAMDMAAAFGDLGSGMQLADDANLQYSTSLVQLAADMASFKNISIDRAKTALTGIYTGETEALKSMGVVMTEANLQQYAQAHGIKTSYSEMTQAQKVALRYNYVMDACANSLGDFARTSGGTANQTRMLAENAKQLAVSFGQTLAPMANRLIQSCNGLLQKLQQLNPETRETIVTAAMIVAAIGPLLTMIGKGITAYQAITKAIAGMTAAQTAALGPIALAAAALAGLAIIVTQTIQTYREHNAVAIELAETSRDVAAALQEGEQAMQTSLAAADANAAMARTYVDRLRELEAQESLTNAQRTEAAFLVNQLNGLYPGLNAQIDEQTGLVAGGTAAIYNQIKAMQAKVRYEVYEERYRAALEAVADIEWEVAAAEQEHKAKASQLESIRRQQISVEQQLANQYGLTIAQLQAMDGHALAAFATQNKGAYDLYTQYLNLGYQAGQTTRQIGALDSSIAAAEQTMAAAGDSAGSAEEILLSLAGSLQDPVVPAIDGASDSLSDFGDVEAEAAQKTINYTDQIINGFARMDKGVKTSVANVINTLHANNEEYETWINDLYTLVDRGVDQGVIQSLYQMGPAYRSVVAELTEINNDDLQAFVAEMQRAGAQGGADFAAGVESRLAASERTLESRGAALGRAVSRGFNTTLEIHSPSRVAMESADNYVDGIVLRLDEGVNAVQEASARLADKGLMRVDYTAAGINAGTVPANGIAAAARTRSDTTPPRTASVTQNNYYTTRELSSYELYQQQQRASRALARELETA